MMLRADKETETYDNYSMLPLIDFHTDNFLSTNIN